jgi:hypothetical protein
MGDRKRSEWTEAMRDHEREVAQLARAISCIETAPGASRQVRQHVVYLTAQIMKHHISMALLSSRLGVAEPSVH